MGFFCLAVVLSVALAVPAVSLEDDDLDFDVRGPAGLKKCQDLIQKNNGLLKSCLKSGRKIFSYKFHSQCLTLIRYTLQFTIFFLVKSLEISEDMDVEMRGKNKKEVPAKCIAIKNKVKQIKKKCGNNKNKKN